MKYAKRILNFAFLNIFILSFILPSVFALSNNTSFSNAFSTFGKFIYAVTQNEYAVYGLTVIFFTVLFYAIFCAALGRVTVFGENGVPNKYGRLTAFSLAALSSLGIFALIYTNGGPGGVRGILESTLKPFGMYGGMAVAILSFMVIYYGFGSADGARQWRIAMFAAGFGMVLYGTLVSQDNVMYWGWLIVLLALIFFMTSMFAANRTPGDPAAPGPAAPATPGGVPPPDGRPGNIPRFGAVHEGNQVRLSWDAAPNATSYEIRRRVLPPPRGIVGRLWNRTAALRSVEILNNHAGTDYIHNVDVDPAVNYEYRIRGRNNIGHSDQWALDNAIYTPTPVSVTVTLVDPPGGNPGTNVNVRVIGTGFQPGCIVSFINAAGVNNNLTPHAPFNVNPDNTIISFVLRVDGHAIPGADYQVRVVNPDGSNATSAGPLFRINGVVPTSTVVGIVTTPNVSLGPGSFGAYDSPNMTITIGTISSNVGRNARLRKGEVRVNNVPDGTYQIDVTDPSGYFVFSPFARSRTIAYHNRNPVTGNVDLSGLLMVPNTPPPGMRLDYDPVTDTFSWI